GIEGYNGPGKITKNLIIDKSFYGENLVTSNRLWIEHPTKPQAISFKSTTRVGIDYAGNTWKNKPWRFILD
ncbi:MAG TPA: DNA-3-methyladenine glycosylase, partial [Bacteroidales bacterium]|nr:DNA-3-methyladenine glycosylase [Bacteroidales bacterium]